MSDRDIVALRSVSVRLDGRVRLHDVDLTLSEGCRVAIVGSTAAGKSILARSLVGLQKLETGTLHHRGEDTRSSPALVRLRREVHLIWQHPDRAMDPRMSCAEVIAHARTLAGHMSLTTRRLHELCDSVELPIELLDRKLPSLSGGEKQRVAVARALACEPKLLIADETTSGLDSPTAFRIVETLSAASARGMALLFITHDLTLLPGLVDEVIVLADGRIVERNESSQLLSGPQSASAKALVAAIPTWPVPDQRRGPTVPPCD